MHLKLEKQSIFERENLIVGEKFCSVANILLVLLEHFVSSCILGGVGIYLRSRKYTFLDFNTQHFIMPFSSVREEPPYTFPQTPLYLSLFAF